MNKLLKSIFLATGAIAGLWIHNSAQAAYIGCIVIPSQQQPEQWGNGVYNKNNVCDNGECHKYYFTQCGLNCFATICYAADSVTSWVPQVVPVESGPIDLSCGGSQAFPQYSQASGTRAAYVCAGGTQSVCGSCPSEPWQDYIDDWNNGDPVITDYVSVTCNCPTR